jgi:hypothetical protein
MNIVDVAQKTGSAVLRSPLTKTILAATAGYIASLWTGRAYEKLFMEQPTDIIES